LISVEGVAGVEQVPKPILERDGTDQGRNGYFSSSSRRFDYFRKSFEVYIAKGMTQHSFLLITCKEIICSEGEKRTSNCKCFSLSVDNFLRNDAAERAPH
jgi:hypothetical protein